LHDSSHPPLVELTLSNDNYPTGIPPIKAVACTESSILLLCEEVLELMPLAPSANNAFLFSFSPHPHVQRSTYVVKVSKALDSAPEAPGPIFGAEVGVVQITSSISTFAALTGTHTTPPADAEMTQWTVLRGRDLSLSSRW
jgi:hypothetical protein